MAGVVILWILCSVVSAVIASSHGGSGALGFVIGVLLGPFGIIIAFFLGGEREKAAKTWPSAPPRNARAASSL
jgi:hypothetical protein